MENLAEAQLDEPIEDPPESPPDEPMDALPEQQLDEQVEDSGPPLPQLDDVPLIQVARQPIRPDDERCLQMLTSCENLEDILGLGLPCDFIVSV